MHQPLYVITAKGLELLRDQGLNEGGEQRRNVPTCSAVTSLHNLVVTDCLVSLKVALRSASELELPVLATEAELWPLAVQRCDGSTLSPRIVPDAVFTIRNRTANETQTFYLEVVRSGVSGGNRRLQEKFARYAAWVHERRFTRVYGHERIRAVLIATTSPERAEHFRRLAEKLAHGRNLFWFGVYEELSTDGQYHSTFTPESILRLPWTTVDQRKITLLDAVAPPLSH